MTEQPRLDSETLHELVIYADVDEDREPTYISLWAVHGDEDHRRLEYPLVQYVDDMTVMGSADQEFGTIDGEPVPEDFCEFVAGQMVRFVEEGEHALDDLFTFAPDEWEHGEPFMARQLLGMVVHHETVPFEVEWILERGMEQIEENIEVDEVSIGDE